MVLENSVPSSVSVIYFVLYRHHVFPSWCSNVTLQPASLRSEHQALRKPYVVRHVYQTVLLRGELRQLKEEDLWFRIRVDMFLEHLQ